jgi:hypothetical protein
MSADPKMAECESRGKPSQNPMHVAKTGVSANTGECAVCLDRMGRAYNGNKCELCAGTLPAHVKCMDRVCRSTLVCRRFGECPLCREMGGFGGIEPIIVVVPHAVVPDNVASESFLYHICKQVIVFCLKISAGTVFGYCIYAALRRTA